jgi:hypothetical protein
MILLSAPLRAQPSDEKKAVDSFKAYVQRHLDSYKTNRRERVLLFPGGWLHQYIEADASSPKMDIQRTNSLITPYTGTLEFELTRHFTAFHKSSEEALNDRNFANVDVNVHQHSYAYQDEHWTPKTRRYHDPEVDRTLAKTNALLGKPVSEDYIRWSNCTAAMD